MASPVSVSAYWKPPVGYAEVRLLMIAALFGSIEFEANVETRRGHFRVPGIVETVGEPIRNPVTGAEHRARIDLPHGFEYRIAEAASATTRATAAIALPGLENTHSHFAHMHVSNKGVLD